MGQQRCRLAGPRMGVEGVPRPGRGIGGDERVSGTMYRAVAADARQWPGFSRHAFAPFRRCLIFSPRFHARPGNVTGHIEEMLLCAAKLGAVQDPS